MNKSKVIRKCVISCLFFCVVAVLNLKINYFVIPEQDNMLETQSNLFTICSVFAGFSFSILGLIMGVFSEKIIEELKGTTLIQRKCTCIVQSIIYFCISGFVSLIFILGFNIYLSHYTGKDVLVNNILYINGIGFLFLGMIYFIVAVKNLFDIIEKIYGFNNKVFEDKRRNYEESRKIIAKKRKEDENIV